MTALAGPAYAVAVAFWVLTAVYALLASQDFIYEQFLKPELVAPVAVFARDWAFISAGALAVWVLPRTAALRRLDPATLLATVIWLATAGAAFVWPLSTLSPGVEPIAAAAGTMVVVIALAMSEHPALYDAASTSRPATASDFFACALAGLVVGAIDAGVRLMAPSADGVAVSVADTLGVGLRLHLLVGMAVFLALTIVRGLAGFFERPARIEAGLTVVGLALVLGWFLHRVVLASISYIDASAAIAAYSAGLALAFAMTARALTRLAHPDDGAASVVGHLAPAWTASVGGLAAWVAIVAGIGAGADAASRLGDWNFVLSRLGVLGVWILALAGARRFVRMPGGGSPPVFFGLALAVLAGHLALLRAGPPMPAEGAMPPGARWIADLLEPPSDGPAELFAMLPSHTNIPTSRPVTPVRIDWAPLQGAPSAARPHIFMFVVDSLRRDYLSPYNRRVGFTPAIAAFARDSLVYANAFTQYGATGLSVPSIWIGGLPLHKQYVTPFAPMNTLARLLDHEAYEQWISMDNILEVILPASERRMPLDAGVPVKDFAFCRTLDEVRGRLRTRAADAPPAFAYSLPQDIHVSVVTREGAAPVDAEAYAGFYAPVASRVRRFDACFGAFIDDLKAMGLYDESIIVLTSDHGDSLGEGGRMGHAYTLYPEVVRVPLIVHVPPAMRARYTWDVARPAYTTDITPTLYRLLGHDPVPPGPHFGRPLARLQGAPPTAPGDRMVASSYGSVYGVLLNDATTLYVADAIQRRDMAFTIGAGAEPGTAVVVDAATRAQGADRIRRTVEAIARSYRFSPASR